MRQFFIPCRVSSASRFVLAGLLLLLLAGAGCKKTAAEEASDSDANGYFCPACELKFYTKRSDFPFLCPKCGKNGIAEVVGYRCAKDQHLTLVEKGKRSGIVCEQCGAALSGMILPREKDLKAWGAAEY
jgi:predicted RNA-binding Zn-ribbon protein involved in translation (DUF1610 family)